MPLKKKVKEPLKSDSGKINSLVMNTGSWQARDAAQALGVSADGAAYAIGFICSCGAFLVVVFYCCTFAL